MTFVGVRLIEETTEYRFVLLKKWDEILEANICLLEIRCPLNMEFRSKKCLLFTKNGVKQ